MNRKDGTEYSGEWEDNLKHGTGIMSGEKQEPALTYWAKDKLVNVYKREGNKNNDLVTEGGDTLKIDAQEAVSVIPGKL